MPPTGPVPANWSWAGGPVDPGPCVLVDVDGVISDGSHRQHFLRGGHKDYKNFFANAYADTPIEGSIALLDQFDAGLTVVLLTARPDDLRTTTIDWVAGHRYRWELLVMRGRADARYSSPEFKRRAVRELRAYGFEPRLALDDDHRNVDMFRSEGIDTLYVHSGYYEH